MDPDLAAPIFVRGLSTEEARARQARVGPNLITQRERRGVLQVMGAVLSEPMFLLLLVAAGLYLVLGDLGEGLLLSAFAILTLALVIWQVHRSTRALDALRELAAPQVRVWRDGRPCVIAARDLVPGDVIAVAEGERVTADAVLREAATLSVDESLLTGESASVHKRPVSGATDVVDGVSRLHAGTLVVAGHGVAEVIAIGAHTAMGRIGASLADIDLAPTPLQRELRRLVRWLALGALAVSSLLVVWYGLRAGDWVQGLLAGIALAMALLPEEFPMVLAVFLALGARRLARVQVLARRPAVVEALGAATVLCVDKTGTLTENRMRVHKLLVMDADAVTAPGEAWPDAVHGLLEYAMLASQRGGVEPMDAALYEQGDARLAGTDRLHPRWRVAQAHGIAPDLMAVTQVWVGEDGLHRVAAKGAPEAIASLCHLPPQAREALRVQAQSLATRGLRVLAVARGRERTEPAPHAHDNDFTLLGLVAFEDPLRPSVPEAVAQAHRAGIAVVMITGDHPATALAIATQAGIAVQAGVLTGAQLQAMDDTALSKAVRQVRVYARVTPQDKLRLVRALDRNGEVVAMTGDGVNDAPALKAAHIGIAMGVRGTDVAREAASIVLLDDDFGRIVEGVRLGRRIDDNLRKVMTYIIAIHLPIAGLALLPLLLGLPPMMLPVHVVVTEMIVNPVCSLVFESAPQARGLMQRPPRAAGALLVDRALVMRALAQGAGLLGVALAAYALALGAGLPTDEARTLAFVGLTAGNLSMVVVNAGAGLPLRDLWGPQFRSFQVVAALATGLIVMAVTVPAVRDLMKFASPPVGALAGVLAAVGAVMVLAWRLQPQRP